MDSYPYIYLEIEKNQNVQDIFFFKLLHNLYKSKSTVKNIFLPWLQVHFHVEEIKK